MAANRGIQDFFELRAGLAGMLDFVQAATEFMDEQGIAIQKGRGTYNKRKAAATNGDGAGPSIEALREKATALFQKRKKIARRFGGRSAAVGKKASEPDGNHLTFIEAGKILKMTDSAVRTLMKKGRLPKPTYELRPMKKRPDIKMKVQVVPTEAVEALAARWKAEKKNGRRAEA